MPSIDDTLETLVSRTVGDVETSIAQDVPLLEKSVLRVLATVQAAGIHEQYQYFRYLRRQMLPDTAESEFLRRHAKIWGINAKPATLAAGPAQFAGQDGAVILAGSRVLGLNRTEYEVTDSGTIAAGVAVLNVRALETGAIANLSAGTKLTLVNAIPGVTGEVVVIAPGIAGGFDAEGDPDLLDRLLERIRRPPQGGAKADYLQWAREVPGVTRAWAIGFHMGPGTVGVLFVVDSAVDRIPDAATVARVQSYLDDEVRRVVTARPIVFAPLRRVVNLELRVVPDTPEIRAAITNELREYLPIVGEPGRLVALSELSALVSAVPGESYHELLAPVDAINVGITEILELGTVSWS